MSTFQGYPQAFPGGTSELYTTPFPITPGTRARDSSGNEYVFCDFTGNVYPEIAVIIGSDFTAQTPATTGWIGPLGVVADLGKNGNTSAPVSPWTSDQAGWVQIYGRAFVQVGANASSPSDAANGPTTVRTSAAIAFILPTSATTPAGVLDMVSDGINSGAVSDAVWQVQGMSVATDVSVGDVSAVTAVSATHYGARAAVFLNYPVVEFVEDIAAS